MAGRAARRTPNSQHGGRQRRHRKAGEARLSPECPLLRDVISKSRHLCPAMHHTNIMFTDCITLISK